LFSSKNVLGVLLSKNGIFSDFLGKKCGKLATLALFSYIPGGFEGIFDFFDSPTTIPTTTPRLGTPPVNSLRTKQFLSCSPGLK
jgi:hypothetical protein